MTLAGEVMKKACGQGMRGDGWRVVLYNLFNNKTRAYDTVAQALKVQC